jgi:GntR family transcriptional regulator / MocR family aminotransferase
VVQLQDPFCDNLYVPFFMAKRASAVELVLSPRRAGTPAYRWLYSALRTEILAGRLRPGTRLPATRDFAHHYGLARGTIVVAFEQLKSEGYIEGRVGAGTHVSKTLPEDLLHVAHTNRAQPPAAQRRFLSDYSRRARLFPGYELRPIRAFRSHLPALDLFPATLWAKISLRRWRRISRTRLMGCDPLGYPPLRQAVAEYLSTARGVNCVAEQVAIVSSVQEALDLAGRLFLNPGDRVCIENPGYTGAALAFKAFGASIFAGDLDKEGIKVAQLPTRGVRLIYITPAHQFPLGITMSLARRLQLLEWARKSSALIFEDDYDSEFRYSGRPIPSLQGLDRRGLVLYAGSFSKVLFPALRLGYLVFPPDLANHLEAIRSLNSRHAPVVDQVVLSEFITEGHFARHIRRMREIYAERLSVLLAEARRNLAGLLAISDVEAGLQTVGWLGGGLNAEAAAVAAARRNVDVTPVSRYELGRRIPEALQLGFAAVDKNEIRRGIRELTIALEGELHGV